MKKRIISRRFAASRRSAAARTFRLAVEVLGDRIVPSGAKVTLPIVYMSPHGPVDTPWPYPGDFGYTPQQLTHGYGVDNVTFGSVAGTGAGTTIAIIDAFDDPEFVDSTDPNFASSDLAQFDANFGLPNPPSFKKVSSTGSSTQLPQADPGWAGEIALDIESAHAFAPQANIILVEANDDSDDSLAAAVNYARSLPQVNVVSMSYGGQESPFDTSENNIYTTPAGHIGMTFVAATGDDGAPGGYPAYAPTVIAVGGTSLSLDSAGNFISETGWDGSGGGISIDQSQPTFQTGVVSQSTGFRTIPDVALNADPDTGVAVYDTYNNSPATPWSQVGGTSLATPCMAAIIAIADQGRSVYGLGSLDGASQVLPKMYSLASNSADFRDITSGDNGFSAGTGYDLVTGIGSPHVPQLVTALVGHTGTTGGTGGTGTGGTGTGTGTTGGTTGTVLSGTAFVGASAGQPPLIQLIDMTTGAVEWQTMAFATNFTGGVRVARGDVNGDGVPDLIVAAGPGGGPHVEVFDGVTHDMIDSFYAYNANFHGGVFVAAGDVNGDGKADIITGAGAGGGPHVEVFSGVGLTVLDSFYAYNANFTGGVTVAAGDVNGDGIADIITAAGAGGGPHVEAFSGVDLAVLDSFYAYAPTYTGGVNVAAGDLVAGGKAYIITGPGTGAPNVEVFNGATGHATASFAAAYGGSVESQVASDQPAPYAGGARVAAIDYNGDGLADVVVLPGVGGTPEGQVFAGTSGIALGTFNVLSSSYLDGVYVG